MSSPPKDSQAAEPLNPFFDDLETAYGTNSHGTFVTPPYADSECLTDYEPLKLSTLRVFCASRATVLKNPLVLVEQLLITIIFVGCAAPVYHYFKKDLDSPTGSKDEVSLRRFLSQQESKMRAFAMIMTGLSSFLLTFYTAIIVGRWWTMRTAGVGAIKAATVDMHMLLYQCVTQEEKYLSAVQRYGRASLMLVVMWRTKTLDQLKDVMMKRQILTEDECDRLLKCGHCLHETIWSWQAAIITSLNSQGKIKSDKLFAMLLEKCTEGRAAVQCIHTHLAVRVPMMYVHLLGLLVKMHNLVLAVIMGLLFGAALRSGYVILCVQLFARTVILPFLFNAILLINCDLADPFNGGEGDFPCEMYQGAIAKDCKGIMDVAKNVPDWMLDKKNEDGAPQSPNSPLVCKKRMLDKKK